MSQITYADKVALSPQPDVADINKVTDDDMNMIKNAHNDTDNKVINITGQVLWTNPSPTSTFGEQTITLSSNDFDFYEIIYYIAVTNQQILTAKSLKGHGTRIIVPGTTGFEYRTVTSNSDTSYTINSLSNNENGVPIYIVGYKTGLFNV